MNWTEKPGVLLGSAAIAALLFPMALLFFWDAWTTRANLQEDRALLLSHETRLAASAENLQKYGEFLAKSAKFHKQVRRLGLEPQRWENLEVALDKEELSYPQIAEILNQAVSGPKHHFAPKLLEIVAPPRPLTEAEKKKLPPAEPGKAEEKHTEPVLTLHGLYVTRRAAP